MCSDTNGRLVRCIFEGNWTKILHFKASCFFFSNFLTVLFWVVIPLPSLYYLLSFTSVYLRPYMRWTSYSHIFIFVCYVGFWRLQRVACSWKWDVFASHEVGLDKNNGAFEHGLEGKCSGNNFDQLLPKTCSTLLVESELITSCPLWRTGLKL